MYTLATGPFKSSAIMLCSVGPAGYGGFCGLTEGHLTCLDHLMSAFPCSAPTPPQPLSIIECSVPLRQLQSTELADACAPCSTPSQLLSPLSCPLKVCSMPLLYRQNNSLFPLCPRMLTAPACPASLDLTFRPPGQRAAHLPPPASLVAPGEPGPALGAYTCLALGPGTVLGPGVPQNSERMGNLTHTVRRASRRKSHRRASGKSC